MSDIKKTSQENFDAEFDAFLCDENSHLDALYRKLPQPQPNATIDARIRMQARKALHEDGEASSTTAQPRAVSTASPSRRHRWLPAFSAAATLVLVAGLAWRLIPPTSPTPVTVPMPNAVPPPVASDVPATPAQPPPPAATAPSISAPPQASTELADSATLYRHKLHRAMNAETDSPPTANADQSVVGGGMLAAPPKAAAPAEQARAKTSPKPALAAAPAPTAAESAKPAAADRYAPAAASALSTPRQSAPESSAETGRLFPGDTTAAGPPSTILPDPSAPAHYRWEAADGDFANTPLHSGIYPPDPPPLRAWVEIVRTMLRDGHRDAAKKALSDLCRSHPDFRVPADLRGLE